MGVSCFLADVHLGLNYKDPKEREARFVSVLENLPEQTTDLFLLGDIFDFWYEWKYVIPSKYIKTLAAFSAVVDRGIKIHYFTGNHDIWLYNFFQKELGAEVIKEPKVFELEGKRFYLAHGDGLWYNPLDYRLLEWLFKNRTAQFMFSAFIPPRWAFAFGNWWSKHNRLTHEMSGSELAALTETVKNEALKWAQEYQSKLGQDKKIDYFIMGHFHTPFTADVPGGGKFFMLGDWIHHPDYVLHGATTELIHL